MNQCRQEKSCQNLFEINPVDMKEKIFISCQCVFTISQLSPLREGWGLLFEKKRMPFTQGCFMSCLVQINPVILEKIFTSYKCVFTFFAIFSPRRRFNKLVFISHNDALCQVWLMCHVVLEKIFKSRQCIFTILQLSFLGELHLNKFELSSPKDALCEVCLKLTQWI